MLLSASPGFTHFLGSVTQRLGLDSLRLKQIYRRAALLRLPFAPPVMPEDCIFWRDGAGMARLAQLPRGALSGPVQEDKAAALRVLSTLVKKTIEQRGALDLREIDGLNAAQAGSFAHLEDFASSAQCRPFRILSYQDFVRTLNLALPGFPGEESIRLLAADWLYGRLFWAGEQQREAFACAVAYARLRGLAVTLPAQIERYQIDKAGLAALRAHYHVLVMPPSAWTSPGFMHLLLENNVPYARLARLHEGGQEVLLLPRNKARSNALGLGLREAGAVDIADCIAKHIVPAA